MRTITTAFAALLATTGFAAAQGVVVGTDALNDRVDDIVRDIDRDFGRARSAADAGLPPQGWTGSASLGFAATSGNTDSADLTAAGRMTYGQGPNAYTFGFGFEYGEDEDVRTRAEAFVVGEYTRQLNGPLYAFGLGSYQYDEFSTFEDDAFLGGGLGYRIIATDTQAWRLQAGPGVRYTEDQLGETETEGAALVSSRYYQAFSPTVSLTNDTDAIWSDEAEWTVRNDLGVNIAITDAASTRISYRTDWVENPLPGRERTDNRFGVSLVYGF